MFGQVVLNINIHQRKAKRKKEEEVLLTPSFGAAMTLLTKR